MRVYLDNKTKFQEQIEVTCLTFEKERSKQKTTGGNQLLLNKRLLMIIFPTR